MDGRATPAHKNISLIQPSQRVSQHLKMALLRIPAEAEADSAGFQGPGAFMGKGGAVKSGPDRNAALRQNRRRIFAGASGEK